MKKILLFLLAVLMLCAIALPVMASDDSGDGDDTHETTVNATVVIAPPVIEKHIMGDVDLNGDLAAADASAILRLIVRLENWDSEGRNFALGDCSFSNTREDAFGNWVIGHEVGGVWTASDSAEDRSNAVTSADASMILRFIVRLERTWYYNDHSYYMLNGVMKSSVPTVLWDFLVG